MRRLSFAAAAIALVVALGWWSSSSPTDPGATPVTRAPADRAALPAGQPLPGGAPLPMAFPSAPTAAPSAAPAPTLREAAPLGSGETPDLRADGQGNLVTDAHTRDELERLLALNGRAEALTLLQGLQGALPATAYRQAVDAFYAYQNYAIAAGQLTTPTQPVVDEAGAARQLDALHALRVDHFGPAVAAAYFGEEEATARSLLEAMRAQPESGATLAERAERAARAQGTSAPER